VHKAAEALGIEVRHPASLKGAEEQAAFAALGADVAVVAAYGLILPQTVLDAPKHGCLNIHASLLPRWRGAAPIQRAILAGDEETGVTIMQMEAGLDTGPMLAAARTPIGGKAGGELTTELAELGARLMVEVLADFPHRQAEVQPSDGVTYASKIDKAETRIDWRMGARQIERQIRAFSLAPGAWFEHEGERIKILKAHLEQFDQGSFPMYYQAEPGRVMLDFMIECHQGSPEAKNDYLVPDIVQKAGKPAMAIADFLRGNPIPPDTVLI
jgi:methionyl-tRNA formyltransferase